MHPTLAVFVLLVALAIYRRGAAGRRHGANGCVFLALLVLGFT